MKPKVKKAEPKKKLDWSWASHQALENGMEQWELYTNCSPIPLATVHGFVYRAPKKDKLGRDRVFFVMGGFVPEYARRRGARTRLHKEMAKHFVAIVTFSGTKDGEPWMKAIGAKKIRPWGLWEYPV